MINSFHPPNTLKQRPVAAFLHVVVMVARQPLHPGKVASGVALAIDEETKGLVRPVIESNLRLAKQMRCHTASNAAPAEDENQPAHIFRTEMNSYGLD
ncbi:MAG: hypothetical protein SOH59_07800 [Heyndrickxia faecalis]|jgi:glycosyltransferase A (GT-A) superfamily protein (DUF2064 family)|uniref:hypothetical protein n=1 Tax=Heyndrickxia TaxID=2837504 RepID=UPI00047DF325|nr:MULTISPECIES: hypothetical protein [Heyndrickxia]AVD55935.1 hypothetical protein C3766_07220 [Heyndrickxia coagulans]MCI1575385.1 hypothetical protein [Heyndrickxia coagulans]MED4920619.1 hypothetical protein [Weizmannia sp. CD-2023]UXC23746.1 hypothetical protein N4P52_06950 [Heyndrickxia coagulans]